MSTTGPGPGRNPGQRPSPHRQLQINKNRKEVGTAMEKSNPGIEETERRDGVTVILRHRHYGVHTDYAETVIPGKFSDYATPRPGATRDHFVIDEDKLLAKLPEGFLPRQPMRILLAVEDEDGGTGQVGLSRFRDWAKYFDAYCLNLVKDGSEAGR